MLIRKHFSPHSILYFEKQEGKVAPNIPIYSELTFVQRLPFQPWGGTFRSAWLMCTLVSGDSRGRGRRTWPKLREHLVAAAPEQSSWAWPPRGCVGLGTSRAAWSSVLQNPGMSPATPWNGPAQPLSCWKTADP